MSETAAEQDAAADKAAKAAKTVKAAHTPFAAILGVPRARRMQRTAIVVATSLLALVIYGLYWATGFITWAVFAAASGAVLVLIALFVPVFYSGANLRLRDPSLFLLQAMCAVVITSYVMVHAGVARPGLTLLYLAALALSAMRFERRTYIAAAVFVQLSYAVTIAAAMRMGDAQFDLRAELLHWTLLLLALPWVGWLASYLTRLRRQIRAGEAVYRVMWDTSIDAMVIFDQRGTIRLVNPAAERLFDCSAAHMTGKSVTAFAPERLRARMKRDLGGYLAGTKPASDWNLVEGIFLTATGREVPVEAAIAELGGPGASGALFDDGSRRLALFARDISQRHALEKIKDDFIATVSYELRTPLTAIVGAVEALQEDGAAQLSPHASGLLGMAASGADRLKRLIDTILHLQKLDTEGIAFAPEPVAVSDLIAAALVAAREAAAVQGKFIVTTRIAGNPAVRADRRWIREVLANLIDNGLNYSPPGASVVVGAAVNGASVRFSVIDQGTGVPPEFASRIFTRFARADTSHSRVQGGAGLGLSLCKAAVEGCGGAIGHFNNPVKGATFWFDLPLAQ